jgi:hypothetical protein
MEGLPHCLNRGYLLYELDLKVICPSIGKNLYKLIFRAISSIIYSMKAAAEVKFRLLLICLWCKYAITIRNIGFRNDVVS